MNDKLETHENVKFTHEKKHGHTDLYQIWTLRTFHSDNTAVITWKNAKLKINTLKVLGMLISK